MIFPIFTGTPQNPDRIDNPDDFDLDSQVFIAAQPQLQSESNIVANYLNQLEFDPFNWGTLDGVNPSRVALDKSPAVPVSGTDFGLVFVQKADDSIFSISQFPNKGNLTGQFVETLAPLTEPYGFVVDELRPTVNMVSVSQSIADQESIYESNAKGFYESQTDFINSFSSFEEYMYFRVLSDEDFGSVLDATTIFEDWGTLP